MSISRSFNIHELASLYGVDAGDFQAVKKPGNYNETYQFERAGELFILRVSPLGEDTLVLQRSMEYLNEHFHLGSPVVEPVMSNNQNLVEEIIAHDDSRYCVTVTRRARGETHDLLARDTLPAGVFLEIGKSLAVLHDHARVIGSNSYGFNYWYENENCFNVLNPGEFEDDRIVSRYREYRSRCIEQMDIKYKSGIIHADLHFSNIVVDPDVGRVTFCDFDDSCIGSFLMDVAMVIFDLNVILQCSDKDVVTKDLVRAFIDGYNHGGLPDSISLSAVQDFLKLLELSLFIQYHDYYSELEKPDGWLKLFFDGRKERIMAGVPFLVW